MLLNCDFIVFVLRVHVVKLITQTLTQIYGRLQAVLNKILLANTC